MRRIKTILAAILLCTLMITACACDRTSEVEYNGKKLTPEEIEIIGQRFETEMETETVTETESETETETETETEIETETETETETKAETKAETEEPADGIVYWTAGGTVWHEWKTCYRLSTKTAAVKGNVEQAKAAGKERGCSICCNGSEG